jgi:hypothetical protein
MPNNAFKLETVDCQISRQVIQQSLPL